VATTAQDSTQCSWTVDMDFAHVCVFGAVCAFCHLPARALPMPCALYLHVFARPLLRAFHIQTPVGPPLPSVHGCINITCNTNDVQKPRRPHTCMRHAHGRLITHTLSMYVMPSVTGGGNHCMSGNTLTILHAPSLFFFIPTPTVYLRVAAQIGCSRCAHHLITSKYKQIIVFLQLNLGLRVRVVPGFQSCVRHQACAPGLQTGACGTGLVDRSVSQTCARHRLCVPGLQTCACGTGLADGGVTHALLDVAFSVSHSISISFSHARFLSLSHARSFSLSLSLCLSHTHTNMLGAIILILMPSDSD